jgi:hypothetical protein
VVGAGIAPDHPNHEGRFLLFGSNRHWRTVVPRGFPRTHLRAIANNLLLGTCGKASPAVSPPRNAILKQILFRTLAAIGVWIAVSGLSLNVAWHNACEAEASRFQQSYTQSELKEAADLIKSYHQTFKVFPETVVQIMSVTNQSRYLSDLANFGGQDGWNRPLFVSNTGTSCVMISYGRDGKPGGKGLDCDLTSKDWEPQEATPTFSQFLHDMPTGGMIQSCLFCGGIAGLLAAWVIKLPDLSRTGVVTLIMKLAATTVGAVLVAGIISILHIPSGH